MRKTLLLTLGLALATLSATAQTSFSTALDAKSGDNTYETTAADSIFWKYTATQDEVIYVSGLNGSYDNTAVYVQKEGEAVPEEATAKALKGVNFSGKKSAYPVMKGQTAYFMAYNQGTVGFGLEATTMPGLGHGLTAGDALAIELGKEQYIGDAFRTGYSSYDTYATYTATEDGVLLISTKSYVTCTVDGTSYASSYSNNNYAFKVNVESGKTYSVVFNTYSPFIFTTEITHPTAGSLDMPFTLTEGENTVPAEYGTYYYTYTPAKTGYMNISSTETLAGGQVKIYGSLSSVSYNSPSASSAIGSFDVRHEVAYVYGSTVYYVEVTKTESTDAAQKFTFAMEDYKAGEKESNPIDIGELPSTHTLGAATGKFYYSVTVPANTNKFLKVAATDASVTSTVYLYPQGYGSYYGVNGQGSVKADVSDSIEHTYLILWNASETKPIEFTVSYEDIVKGSTMGDPLEAVKGENTVATDGDWYYTYTATQDGKLTVTATPTMSVAFPYYTSYGYLDYREASLSGSTYSFEATKGTSYIIYIGGAKAGDVFVVGEEAFGEGESKATAIDLTEKDGAYTFGSENVNNVWFKYTVKKDGFLDAGTDVDYNYNFTVEFGKSDASYLQQIITTDPQTYDSKYATSVAVKAGETYVMHLSIDGRSLEGKKVYFTERDANPGEALSNPLVLENVGDSIEIPTPSYSAPVWVKVAAKGDVEIKMSESASGYWFANADDAANLANENELIATPSSDYSYYTLTVTGQTGDIYLYFYRGWSASNLTLTKNGDQTTAIQAVNAAATGAVEVYTLGGAKAGASLGGLAKGIYVVKTATGAKKVVVK